MLFRSGAGPFFNIGIIRCSTGDQRRRIRRNRRGRRWWWWSDRCDIDRSTGWIRRRRRGSNDSTIFLGRTWRGRHVNHCHRWCRDRSGRSRCKRCDRQFDFIWFSRRVHGRRWWWRWWSRIYKHQRRERRRDWWTGPRTNWHDIDCGRITGKFNRHERRWWDGSAIHQRSGV